MSNAPVFAGDLKDSAHKLAVLAYHRFGAPSPGGQRTWYYVSEDTFRVQLAALEDDDWQVVGIDDVLRGFSSPHVLPPKAALLTFDDAYRSVLEVACPVLVEFGYPAVVFVPTGYIGDTSHFPGALETVEPICSLEELRELEAAGVSVQSHGVSHVKLSTLSQKQVEAELKQSKAELEDGLDKAVEAFAFPYGDAGESSLAPALERSGYRAGFLYGGAPFCLPPTNSYELPRLPIGSDTNLAVEIRRVIRSDFRHHLQQVRVERHRALAEGRLGVVALGAIESVLASHVPVGSAVIWVEPGLQPVRSARPLLSFPSLPARPWKHFGSGEQGSRVAPWIAPGYAYEFRLYPGADRHAALAATTVVAEQAGSEHPASAPGEQRADLTAEGAYLVALPNPARAAGDRATTEVYWSTGDGSEGEVEVTDYPIEEGVPEDDAAAIAELEHLRASGGDFLLIPPTCHWWLTVYPQLGQHLSTCRTVADHPLAGRLYDLRS